MWVYVTQIHQDLVEFLRFKLFNQIKVLYLQKG